MRRRITQGWSTEPWANRSRSKGARDPTWAAPWWAGGSSEETAVQLQEPGLMGGTEREQRLREVGIRSASPWGHRRHNTVKRQKKI